MFTIVSKLTKAPLRKVVRRFLKYWPWQKGEATEKQCGTLEQLISDKSDVFALSDNELGHTDLVQHQVDTW